MFHRHQFCTGGLDQNTTTKERRMNWKPIMKNLPSATKVPRKTMTRALTQKIRVRLKAPLIVIKPHLPSQRSQGKTSFADMKINLLLNFRFALTFRLNKFTVGKESLMAMTAFVVDAEPHRRRCFELESPQLPDDFLSVCA